MALQIAVEGLLGSWVRSRTDLGRLVASDSVVVSCYERLTSRLRRRDRLLEDVSGAEVLDEEALTLV